MVNKWPYERNGLAKSWPPYMIKVKPSFLFYVLFYYLKSACNYKTENLPKVMTDEGHLTSYIADL